MAPVDLADPYPVVILGDGRFPRHPLPLEILREARTVICLDGGARRAMEHGFTVSLLMGDMDSFEGDPSKLGVDFIQTTGQHNTDLEKALDWCRENDIVRLTLLGMTGYRDDHSLSALLTMKEYVSRLQITVVTDHFAIHYVNDQREFPAKPGQKVSLVSLDSSPSLTTAGLKFALKNESLRTGGHGISNEVVGETFSIDVNKGGVFVFIAHPV